jgi:hypothetical protein
MILRATLIILSALLLAAHFYREMAVIPAMLCLLFPFLLLLRRHWSLLVLQLFTFFGAGVWIITMLRIVGQRQLEGRPWIGVVVILGTVSLVTALAGWLLNTRGFQSRYSRTPE